MSAELTPVALDLSRRGQQIVIERNAEHPESYLWIVIDARRFFMGVLEPGMRRGAVRAMAMRWLAEHPQHHDESAA